MVVLPFLGHVHTKPDIVETAFFYPDSCGQAR